MPNKMQKILTDFNEKIKTSLRIRRETVFIFFSLMMIVSLAILVRCSPVFAGAALIDAFDPWVQYDTAEYLANHSLYDYFNWYSDQTWFPEGVDRSNLRPGLIFGSVIVYKILGFLGIPVTLYQVCYFWPAFVGGLTVFLMFFLGKEILDHRAGILAAFFLAFSPGHMQRTIAGFFDNETIGVLCVLGRFISRCTYAELGWISIRIAYITTNFFDINLSRQIFCSFIDSIYRNRRNGLIDLYYKSIF